MILTKQAIVKSSKYYKELGYDISNKYIYANIEDIPIGSRVIIRAKCDFCENEKEISYKDYNSNIKNGGKFSCCIKCGSLKSKENNLKKYGVEHHFQLKEFKDKKNKSNIEKYGFEQASKSKIVSEKISKKMKSKSEEISKRMKDFYNNLNENDFKNISEKRKKTNLEKWGVENQSQRKDIKEKIKETNLEKWGGYTYESEELMKKVHKTNLEKWNTIYPSQNEKIKNKIKETTLKKWNNENILSCPEIKEKIKQTNLLKYGVDNPMKLEYVVKNLKIKFINKYGTDSYFKTEEFINSNKGKMLTDEDYRKNNLLISSDKYYIKYLGNNISLFKCDNFEDHQFTISSDNYHGRIKNNSKLCTICYPISSGSNKQKEVFYFIQDLYKGKIIENWRKLVNYEIDIYLPELKIGFEFNGLYWHCESKLGKNYHSDKQIFFKKNGIKIYNIWEDDWDFKKDILKSQIKNWLGLNDTKIGARKCEIIEIYDNKIVKEFLNNNHIQGYVRSMIKLGLIYDGELVSLMVFDNLEGRKKMDINNWNLSRFCNKINTNIVGGASKLFNYFIKKYNPERIISYADMDWSDGNLYYKLGFTLSSILKPDYKYIINGKRENKRKFSKSNLKKIGFNINLSESEITKLNNIERIYNCGKLKFIKLLLN